MVSSAYLITIQSLTFDTQSYVNNTQSYVNFCFPQDKVVFSTLHDTSLALFSGKNDYNSVAVWNKNGKMKVEVVQLVIIRN